MALLSVGIGLLLGTAIVVAIVILDSEGRP